MKTKIIFVGESLPQSGKNFFNCKTILFKAIMSVLFLKYGEDFNINKPHDVLLNNFKKYDFMLIDSASEPVNNIKNKFKRNNKIANNFNTLLSNLRKNSDKNTKIILIKKNICNMYQSLLTELGFKVLNNKISPKDYIPFPLYKNNVDKFNKYLLKILP